MATPTPSVIPQQPNNSVITDSTGRMSTPWTLFFNNLVNTVKLHAASILSLQQNVAFSAYQSVAQSLTAAVVTKVNFQTKEFDLTSAFDTTSMRFTPKVAGYYSITGNVYVGSPASGLIYLYKNGAVYKYGEYTPSENISTLSCLVYFNGTTDYLELWVYSSIANTIQTGIPASCFQGVLVARA